jgi:hypothetical protein
MSSGKRGQSKRRFALALLPTYAETYGYVVPKYEDSDAKIDLEGDIAEFSNVLKTKLKETIQRLIAHPEQIEKKGKQCLQTIRE